MLTITGMGMVAKDTPIEEHPQKDSNFTWMRFTMITKDPRIDNRYHFFKIDMRVHNNSLELARSKIVKGRSIQIRIGEAQGNKLESGYCATSIKTRWEWIEILNQYPGKERKQDAPTQ